MERERIERFKLDVADMRSTSGRSRLEFRLEVLGAVLMVTAAVIAFIAYQVSLDQSDPRNVQSDVALTVAMLIVAVLGAALFLRYSMARFLRLWLLRQLYEGQANTERVVESVSTAVGSEHRGGPDGTHAGTEDRVRARSGPETGEDAPTPGREQG